MLPSTAPETPDWDTWDSRRRRTLVFLILAGLYVGYHMVFEWVEFQMFRAEDWYYALRVPPSAFELVYRWFLTLLPVAAWGALIFVALTRFSFLTHRRIAFFLILAGLTFFEADMRWFEMSKKHVTYSEIVVFFTVDASADLGLRPSDYWDFWYIFVNHAIALIVCALLAGPEWRAILAAILKGPAGKTYVGSAVQKASVWLGRAARRVRPERMLGWVDNKAVFAVLALCVLVDPILIWHLDRQESDAEECRSIVRELAERNPLRWQSLDRGWHSIVHRFSEESQELEAANLALQSGEPSLSVPSGSKALFVANRPAPKEPDNVLLIQVESFSAAVFDQMNLPFCHEFAKKCLRLRRHFSAANCTHYGVLGLLYGHPVTFFKGPLEDPMPCEYLAYFKNHGYASRLITMKIMNHHRLGDYLPNWTEPVFEAGNDWSAIPEFHKEFAKPGPRLAYMFYHFTHYPYRHKAEYSRHLPQASEDFSYSRSDLILYREEILNRYKNALLEFDDWLKTVLSKVDLSRTIVVITGDHGEEIFEQGRLGHCSSLNAHQTMTPCLFYVPGVAPADVTFPTSHADVMPSIADALGWEKKPALLGRSIFEDVPFRYAVVCNFEYAKPMRWAVVTEDRKALLERDSDNHLTITSLVDLNGRRLGFRDAPERWAANFRIIRQLEADLKAYGD